VRCALMHSGEGEENAGEDNVGEGDGEDVFPAETHELVVAEAGERPADPDEEHDGRLQPPRKRVTMRQEATIMAAYSPRKKRANFMAAYSVW